MRPWYRFCRIACQALFTLFFRGRVFGVRNVPQTGGVLLVCNHQSYLDPVLATLALPRECHYMARDTLFENPFFKGLIESLNAFPIKRGTADMRAIKETLRRLKNEQLVVTFPEATRTRDGSIGPMQPGVVLLARKTNVPIVPTLILGAFESWPRQSNFPHPRPVLVAYGEPIRPEALAQVDDEACIRMVRDRVLELQKRYAGHVMLSKSV
ncbi:1-acyl-sn-glycerol-3-phosphate acyltransferase [Phycisphaerae bacterium RAS1]|nr:1-acyl-sn-glycerol-3-phosphate acyltransferase [Phycisphaerae bacterium RAS1]